MDETAGPEARDSAGNAETAGAASATAGGTDAPGIGAAATGEPGTEAASADAIPLEGAAGVDQGGMIDGALSLLDAGGPVVLILIGMSVAAIAVLVAKLWQFHAAHLHKDGSVQEAVTLFKRGKTGQALMVADGSRNPVAQALSRAVRGCRRGLPESMVREEVFRFGTASMTELRSGMRVLEVIAGLAPLLGLFGTVLGMISAFQELEAAGNQVNPSVLSGGIWEALLTTAVGLAVAIPTVALHSWLEGRLDSVAHDMDDAVTRIFTEDLSNDSQETHTRGADAFHPVLAAGE